ncbi:DEKNAAC100451 [Brettanomyces naardenensis]|uniref:glutamine--tRNA ligase n=1 Tax=Brettanomyces naardenensis TaxID=13370 RepID=A0A448YF66_BRENA|nr:DEKNAAC100451 [Brettanomyces naardenensis]
MSTFSEDELVRLFSKVGFDDKKIKEILKNDKISKSLGEVIELSGQASLGKPFDKSTDALLHNLASLLKGKHYEHIKYVVNDIVNEKLSTNLQVSEAFKYIKSSEGAKFDNESFEKASGIGITVSADDSKRELRKYFEEHKAEIIEARYRAVPAIFAQVKSLESLKWASPSLFKPAIDSLLLEYLGPKDERDIVKKKSKKAAPAKSKQEEKVEDTLQLDKLHNMFVEGFLGDLHKPGKEPQKWDDVKAAHAEFIQGQVYTRFPPEPNGFLHIGHSKAIMVNFGYAKYYGGHCYLRFDDTNPEKEDQIYFDSIKRCVKWLGYEPWKVTYSSDYFDELYALAEKLISSGYGYVDHSTPEEVKAQRGIKADGTPGGKRVPSPWRSRSIEDSLEDFRRMRDGFYKPGEATLRMKQDLDSPSPQMWDLVAYRVLDKAHPRTGDKWKIYPTYDFTHCLVDSFENITHSLCTTEFVMSRESYEWLCDVLHVYRPPQREYGRLNITGTIMSKRKIARLVNEHYVRSWDDPRLYTLESLRRRGIPPGAILTFINTLGVTTSTTNIQVTRFESAVRDYLNFTTPRLMMVVDPIKVVLDNVNEDFEESVSIPYKPGDEALGSHKLSLTKEFYIDTSDYRPEKSKGYFRWAPEQPVGLMRVPFSISVKSVENDESGKPLIIHAEYLNDSAKHKKPKAYIQWVPISKKQSSPVKVEEVRVYNQLFKSENPASNPDGFLADINPDSEEIIKGALLEPAFRDIEEKSPLNLPIANSQFSIKEEKGPETVRFQAVRVGYFCVDKDSTPDRLILNRVVTLKEDSAKD